MKPIKVLFIIDKLNIGGAQRHILELLKRLDKNKFKPYICCLLYEGELIEEVKLLDVPLIVLNIKKIYDFSSVVGMSKLIRFIKQEKIDIVHTYLFSANIIGNIAARLAGAPLIISARRDTGIHREGKFQHRLAYKFAHSLADKVFAVSNAVRDIVNKYEGVSLNKIITIYNGIELEEGEINVNIENKKKALGIDREDKVVGIIANLSWVKGHKIFLESVKLILQDVPNTKILFIGDGAQRNTLESIVNSRQMQNNVLFLGKRTDVPELLKIMDVSVNTSYSEGMSNTVLESMAMGIPVVATDVDGNKELVINGQTGFLVAAGDTYAMKEKIEFLLNNKEIAHQMGENAKRVVKNKFNLSDMVIRMEDAYINLLREKYNGRYIN